MFKYGFFSSEKNEQGRWCEVGWELHSVCSVCVDSKPQPLLSGSQPNHLKNWWGTVDQKMLGPVTHVAEFKLRPSKAVESSSHGTVTTVTEISAYELMLNWAIWRFLNVLTTHSKSKENNCIVLHNTNLCKYSFTDLLGCNQPNRK